MENIKNQEEGLEKPKTKKERSPAQIESFKLAQETITLHEDNQAAIALSKNPQFHDRKNHKVFFVNEGL